MSSESLRKAAEGYATSTVRFNGVHGDCNTLRLPANRYNLVLGWHGIHHVEAIDFLFDEIEKSLTQDGLFVMCEWIGPRYLQIPYANSIISKLLLRSMFERAERITHQGRRKGRWLQDPPSAFEPSEAVAADRILGALVEKFDVLEKLVFGGLLYPMFEGLGANKSLSGSDTASRRVRWVGRIERVLTKAGIVQPLFMISVARKKALKPKPRM